MYGDFSAETLRLNAELSIYDEYSFPIADGTANQVLNTDGGGTLTWVDVNSIVNGDNLGNHSATQSLDLNNHNIIDVGDITMNEDNWIGIGSSSERIVFDGSQNEIEILGAELGIGTSSPSYNVDVYENINTSAPMLRLYQSNTSGDASALFTTNGGNSFAIGIDASDSDKFKISDNTALGTNDRFVINSAGNIAIGLTNPTYRLHVNTSSSGGIYSYSNPSGNTYSIFGVSEGGGTNMGVRGYANGTASNYGVYGITNNTNATTNIGIFGYAIDATSNYGVYGSAGSTTVNYAGYFYGNLHSTGTNTKAAGAIKIDYPLDPENKILYHSTVESPDMKTIYDGTVILNEKGEAIVNMPEYFEALNMEFRYQLTAIGGASPNLHIAEEISNNKFKIAGGKKGMKISWQITGIRHDAFANKNRIKTVTNKKAKNRGKYLHPRAFNQPKTKGIDFINNENK